MIGFSDTVRTEYPKGYWRPSRVTVSIGEIQHALPGEWRWVTPDMIRVELYIEPQFYHVARSIIYNLAPAFVRIDVIPTLI